MSEKKVASIAAHKKLVNNSIDTPLGTLLSVCDDRALYLLEFIESKSIETKKNTIFKHSSFIHHNRKNQIAISIETEVHAYFEGKLVKFETPICFLGTGFRKNSGKLFILPLLLASHVVIFNTLKL
jgi:AraC family transcriptional regulator of adaptative response/methylated-DNA-[protein]-cysteine methyltransferase